MGVLLLYGFANNAEDADHERRLNHQETTNRKGETMDETSNPSDKLAELERISAELDRRAEQAEARHAETIAAIKGEHVSELGEPDADRLLLLGRLPTAYPN